MKKEAWIYNDNTIVKKTYGKKGTLHEKTGLMRQQKTTVRVKNIERIETRERDSENCREDVGCPGNIRDKNKSR